jgi:hypothetical protein
MPRRRSTGSTRTVPSRTASTRRRVSSARADHQRPQLVAASVSGAIAGAVRALVAWLLDHLAP